MQPAHDATYEGFLSEIQICIQCMHNKFIPLVYLGDPN